MADRCWTDAEGIAELRRLHEAATPGEWQAAENRMGHITFIIAGDEAVAEVYGQDAQAVAISGVLCAARNALPQLLDEIERLRKELDARG